MIMMIEQTVSVSIVRRLWRQNVTQQRDRVTWPRWRRLCHRLPQAPAQCPTHPSPVPVLVAVQQSAPGHWRLLHLMTVAPLTQEHLLHTPTSYFKSISNFNTSTRTIISTHFRMRLVT